MATLADKNLSKYKVQRNVMSIAHMIKSKCDNFAQALKKAWASHNLRKALKSSSEVAFKYTKLKGEARQAKGTTKSELIPEELKSKGMRDHALDMIVYFDLEKSGWRSFHAYQLELAA